MSSISDDITSEPATKYLRTESREEENCTIFDVISDELLFEIFQFINTENIGLMASVCKRFRSVCDSQQWKQHCYNAWRDVDKHVKKGEYLHFHK